MKWFLTEYKITSQLGAWWPTASISLSFENLMHETSASLSLKLNVGYNVLGSIIKTVPFNEPHAK